jgi:integrase
MDSRPTGLTEGICPPGSIRACPRRTARPAVSRDSRGPAGPDYIRIDVLRQVWYTAVEQADLPQGLRIHDLRHTCASLLIAAGTDPKAVQVHLGHSSISVTMDRYAHLFPSDVEALIGRLNDIRTRNLAAQRPVTGNRHRQKMTETPAADAQA